MGWQLIVRFLSNNVFIRRWRERRNFNKAHEGLYLFVFQEGITEVREGRIEKINQLHA